MFSVAQSCTVPYRRFVINCLRHVNGLRCFASLSLRGTSGERGELNKCASSPRPSPPFEEERERKRGGALQATLLPNTID